MARPESSIYKLCLVCSMIGNLFFGVNLYVGPRGGWKWKAAAEAKLVAAEACSGHGRAFLNAVLVDGRPICKCNPCCGGPDCSLFLPSCAADADRSVSIYPSLVNGHVS
ncbi:hypothetical protein BT93_F1997 [Corymbia citriodora subsp. variegata]|nr:hypothetical protein BT93_F1997 [Corymbia citriodora subsp. variegata]